jgi:hypothetical protein
MITNATDAQERMRLWPEYHDGRVESVLLPRISGLTDS